MPFNNKTIDSNIDVLVSDIDSISVDCLKDLQRIKRDRPNLKIVIITNLKCSSLIQRTIENYVDIHGLFPKSILPVDFKKALQRIEQGERVIHYNTNPYLMEDQKALTKRQMEVLNLLSTGLKNTEVAQRLCISIKTVETHRTHLMKKFGVHNIVQLIGKARTFGLMH